MELFAIVDENGVIIGKATRQKCHSGTFLLHPVVHLHVFNSKGELFLQQRSLNKDIQPGKWDTSVGGHVDYGEEIETALKREAKEELGIFDYSPLFIEKYKFTSPQESELVHCYYTIYDGIFSLDPVEISQGRFWTIEEIDNVLVDRIFTPNFEQEYERIIKPLSFLIKKNG